MELQAVMEKRRSIRNYNPERKVTKEQLEELIKAASYAPSWKNLQTSRYYCVLSENAVKELREKCLPEFNQANSDGAGAYIVTTFVKGMVGFDKNTGSPVNEAGDGWGYYDLGLQNENLLFKAAELGLDTLVMGIRDGEALRELLNIPDSENVVSVIAVGYRGQEPPERPKRKELEVANSTSTMHKIHSKPFEMSDFSTDHMTDATLDMMQKNIDFLEGIRTQFVETKDKALWYSMIQLLPESYNQMRTCTLNYENLVGIYYSRKGHKLAEWHTFCDWVKELPYFEELFIDNE